MAFLKDKGTCVIHNYSSTTRVFNVLQNLAIGE